MSGSDDLKYDRNIALEELKLEIEAYKKIISGLEDLALLRDDGVPKRELEFQLIANKHSLKMCERELKGWK